MPKFRDLTGQKFGRLTAISHCTHISETGKRRTVWRFICDCGNIKDIVGNDVTSGRTRSCGCLHDEAAKAANLIDLTGLRFGKLVVVSETNRTASKRVRWLCRCDCGRIKPIHGQRLTSGLADSCGCESSAKRSAAKTTHGHTINRTFSPTYNTWAGMLARCTNQNHTGYTRYGGAGITVCDTWLTFENFLADMGEKPRNMSIDRINPALGYFKENCRWATNSEQATNKTSVPRFLHDGKNLSAAEWSKITGISSGTIRARIRLGWTTEEALGFKHHAIPPKLSDPITGRFIRSSK